jgi:hypothetical protein
VVRAPKGNKEVADVRYDCPCSCHPSAKYRHGAAEAAHEHCCCGNVHFAGANAEAQLRAYLDERKARGEDAERGPYEITTVQLKAPWGDLIEVSYGIPEINRASGDHDQEHEHEHVH